MNRLLNIPYIFRLTTLIIMCVLRYAGTVRADTTSIQVADSVETEASHSIFDGWDEERLRAYDDSLRSIYYPEAILHTSEFINSESPGKFTAPSKTDLEETYVPSLVYIDDSSVVGDIPIESGISPAGSRTCNVPIEVPAGINGMTPALSLSYDSRNPNSIAGPGWNLSGISSITRSGKCIHYDWVTDAIRKDISDSFYLDGIRLIKKGKGSDHILYVSEFGDIKAKGYISANDICRFEVFYPDGTMALFGKPGDPVGSLTFPITSRTDLFGNTISYSYIINNEIIHISGIQYSGYQIKFEYAQRHFPTTFYRAGHAIEERHVLKSIFIKGLNNYAHRIYELVYVREGVFPLLKQIEVWNEDDDHLNPIILFYGTNSTRPGWDESRTRLMEWYSTSKPNSIRLALGRIDNAGDTDGITVYPNKEPNYSQYKTLSNGRRNVLSNMYDGTEKILVYGNISNPVSLYPASITTGSGFTDLLYADITGSGAEMIVKANSGIGHLNDNPFNCITFTTYEWNPASIISIRHEREFFIPAPAALEPYSDHLPLYFYPGEFDGDGRDEILAVSADCLIENVSLTSTCRVYDLERNVERFEGHLMDFKVTFTGTKVPDPNVALSMSDRIFAMDFDGDGKTDIAHIGENGTDIYTFDITTSRWIPRKTGSFPALSITDIKDCVLTTGDFNGDGLADIATTPTKGNPDNARKIYLSNGAGGFVVVSGHGVYDKSDIYVPADLNHDGYTDIIGYADSKIKTYLCGLAGPADNGYSVKKENCVIVPVNPSSRNRFSDVTVLCDSAAFSLDWRDDKSIETLLTGMATSTGMVEKTSYARLNDSHRYVDGIPFHRKSSFCRFPYANLNGPELLVSSTEKFIRGESCGRMDFSYTGAVVHRQGLGFRGFESIRQRDSRGNVELRRYDTSRYGIPTYVETPAIKVEYVYSVDADSDMLPKIRLEIKTEENLLTGDIAYTNYGYDSYGNTIWETVYYSDGVTRETECSYTNNPATEEGYRIGFLTSKAVSVTDGVETITGSETVNTHDRYKPTSVTKHINGNVTGSTALEYDAAGNLTSRTTIPYASKNALTETFGYDSVGLVISKTDILGLKTITEYDATGLPVKITDTRKGVTAFTYDCFGHTIAVTYPDSTVETTSRVWDTESYDGSYTVYVTHTGKPDVAYFRDPLGRDIRKAEIRFDGRLLLTDYEYDAYGRLASETMPYIEGTTPLKTTFSYDQYDRLIMEKRPASQLPVKWEYKGNTVTESINGISIKRTRNPRGELISSEDDGGKITYTLAPDGLPVKITAPGNVVTKFSYDDFRRRIEIDDPSGGISSRTYDEAGNLASYTDAEGNTTSYKYNKYGKPTREISDLFTVTYLYDKYLQPTSIKTSQSSGDTYTYDNFGRISSATSSFARSRSLKREFSYSGGNIHSVKYASNAGELGTETRSYSNGHLTGITFNGADKIFSLVSENNYGQAKSIVSGGLTRTYAYSNTAFPSSRSAVDKSGNTVFSETTIFSGQNGTLSYRIDNVRGISESFTYDSMLRLRQFGREWVYYGANGNITERSDVGRFIYGDGNRPYAITGVEPTCDRIPLYNQDIEFNCIGRPQTITEEDNKVFFSYGYDRVRGCMSTYTNGKLKDTRFYLSGCYEYDQSAREERLYLGGSYYDAPAVFVKKDSVQEIRYILRDYLGSIRVVTDKDGGVLQELSYDAWGNLRDPDTHEVYERGDEPDLLLGRGYTGHEHLPRFGLINMNARLYDPVLGRFLSPDPFVQAPDFTQSLNRYSYCLNNPLSYIDEDGEFLWIVVIGAAVVTGVTNVIVHWDDIKSAGGGWNSFWKGAAYFGVGAVAGGAGAVAGMAVLPVISANIASIATMTSAQFTAATMGILPGAAFGAASGASEGFLMNFGNTFVDGGNLSDALSLGATGFIESGLSGAILGGISGGYSAYNAGEDIWSGNLSKVPRSESLLRNDANSFFQGAADNGPTYTGYFGYENGTVRYVGITGRDPNIRFQEHIRSRSPRSGLKFEEISIFGTKIEARIWEQQQINKYGLQKYGGQLFNKRNEISPINWIKYGIKF